MIRMNLNQQSFQYRLKAAMSCFIPAGVAFVFYRCGAASSSSSGQAIPDKTCAASNDKAKKTASVLLVETAESLQNTTIQIPLRRHPPHLANKDEILTVELTLERLLKGQFIRPAFRSLLASNGKLPRERLDSYYFTGYPECLGYAQRMVSEGVWHDTYRGEDVAQRTDTLHNKQEVEESEDKKAKGEEEARNTHRKKVCLPFEFEVIYDDFGNAKSNDYEPADFDSGDEKGYRRDYLGEDDMDELEGADWSGRPGFRCRCCG